MKTSAVLTTVFFAIASLAAPAPMPENINPNACIDVQPGYPAGVCPSPYTFSYLKYCSTGDRGVENCPTISAEPKCCIV
ncbi:hypothetical protein BFW01_g7531 [Lasiodiplodia theobromae]|uniref:uncharacterized protein n=1 Tax=Lasiodiplodia theobromae TaxID=45133 RepID=UPI0015C39455|nr:uncharacterized protein LTHEOB_11449 [Lasiodiplodia theobromae]KAF4537677.1 hypothetical protein LTHEOB_11449 [Lasiodiplodia theobromae]KAF9636635.1 hypothetical protein BFW01_g7531 [Lasiodiplodia theobromae]